MQTVPRNGDVSYRLSRYYPATGELLFRKDRDVRVLDADLTRDPAPSKKVPYQVNENAKLISLGYFVAGYFPHPWIGSAKQNVVAALVYADPDVRRLDAGQSLQFLKGLKECRGGLEFSQQPGIEVVVSSILSNPPS